MRLLPDAFIDSNLADKQTPLHEHVAFLITANQLQKQT